MAAAPGLCRIGAGDFFWMTASAALEIGSSMPAKRSGGQRKSHRLDWILLCVSKPASQPLSEQMNLVA
jgi:hypothetical protein